jgi:hypothetical protein
MRKKKNRIFLLTGEQWLGVLVLTILIVGTMTILKYIQPSKEPIALVEDSIKTQFEDYQTQQDSIYQTQRKKTYKRDTIEIRMQVFDPNTADSCTLVHLGFKP